MAISRKKVSLTADTGTVEGYTSRCMGDVRAVSVDKGTLVQANVVTFSAILSGSDTGGPRATMFSRSTDTGYDATEIMPLSGERIAVSLASADTGEFGLAGTVYVYVDGGS